ncbi:MAG: hypothetical protein JW751_24850 [Polyangiaceae bacterium]|nr:hypothetical protein [Polyangiaceae bacterium]
MAPLNERFGEWHWAQLAVAGTTGWLAVWQSAQARTGARPERPSRPLLPPRWWQSLHATLACRPLSSNPNFWWSMVALFMGAVCEWQRSQFVVASVTG